MKLWRRNEPVVGGWYYVLDDGKVLSADEPGLDRLVTKVENYMEANGIPVPDYLTELVEDQICQRQPEGKCRYTRGIGDIISQGIHGAAKIVDSLTGTTLQKQAKTCGGCGKRRVKLNQLTSR